MSGTSPSGTSPSRSSPSPVTCGASGVYEPLAPSYRPQSLLLVLGEQSFFIFPTVDSFRRIRTLDSDRFVRTARP